MNGKYSHLLAGTLFLFCLAAAVAASGAEVCMQCHDKEMFAKKVKHEPVAGEGCIACHNPHAAKHAGLLPLEVAELCYTCHDDKVDSFREGVMHIPVRRGQCTSCHDPHSSGAPGLMRGSFAETCSVCHESLQQKYKFSHAPYARGKCQQCHSPHNADNYQLLNTSAEKLCRKCHTAAEIRDRHRKFPVAVKTCLTCHDPHGSNNEHTIRAVLHEPYGEGDCTACHENASGTVSQDVCLDCHEEIKDYLLTSHNHLTGTGGNSCTNCHSPHAADTERLLQNRPQLLCRNCHDDLYRRHENKKFSHTATGDQCYICHDVHGTNQIAMVRGDLNAVCLGCHPNQGVFSHPVGPGVIDPRNKMEANCASCHHPHGTNFKGQLRLSGDEDLCKQCHIM